MEEIEEFISLRFDILRYYSPYFFIKEIDENLQFEKLIKSNLLNFTRQADNQVIQVVIKKQTHYFFVSYLPWDADYFQVNTYKILAVLYVHQEFDILCKAVLQFKRLFFRDSKKYCFMHIPAEDILLIQAFTHNRFKLIETRLTYYKGDIDNYQNERFIVRKAENSDISSLKKAALTRNPYDRVHADHFFLPEIADSYLETYAEQAVKGFTDIVLVPDDKVPADAFVAIDYMRGYTELLNCQLCKIVLTAVAPVRKGWHYKLVSEAIYQAKHIHAQFLLMTTQTTNYAVIRNVEKLDFRLGTTTHILSEYTSS